MAVGAELAKRVFLSDIQPQLFASGSFMARAINDDQYVNVNSVELPHSGTIPNVAVNRASVPATISQRSDSATNYLLEELTTDPTVIQMSEALIVNYDKRASVLDQQMKALKLKAANRLLQKWGAGTDAAHTLSTTGSTRATYSPGGVLTGVRKALTVNDMTRVRQLFMTDDVLTDNVSLQGVAVIPASMYTDLLQLPQFTQYYQYGVNTQPLMEGVVGKAFGFDFYVRSQVNYMANAGTTGANLKIEGAFGAAITLAATDQPAAVFYHPDYVRKAMGDIKVFINEDQAAYYGSLFSMAVRFGGLQARNDSKGVVTLIESN
jgi:hypothetical protein